MQTAPVEITLSDDLRRSRLTVFFRLLLALPHFIWYGLWSIAVVPAAVVQWLIVVVRGRPAVRLHGYLQRYVRYTVRLSAYLYLAANPYPPFGGSDPGSYELDMGPVEPEPQSRLGAAFRLVLALPFLALELALAGPGIRFGAYSLVFSSSFVLGTAAVLGWFAALLVGRMPRGLRDAAAYAIAYQAQVYAYALLVTDRFPNGDPGLLPAQGVEPRVTLRLDDDLRRSRLTVFFRYLLALPHMVWLFLWGIAVVVAAVANWVAALVTGSPARSLHGFIARYLRYQTHVNAFVYLVANPFPGFGGRPGTYPVELDLPEPERQHRASIFFRGLLALPAGMVAISLGSALGIAGILGWFFALVTGRMAPGLRKLEAAILRAQADVYAYGLLVSPRFPYLGLTLSAPEQAPEADTEALAG